MCDCHIFSSESFLNLNRSTLCSQHVPISDLLLYNIATYHKNSSHGNYSGTSVLFVPISEVRLFQGENIMYLYEVGTQPSVLINEVSLFQGCPLRGVPLHFSIVYVF